MSSTTSCGFKG